MSAKPPSDTGTPLQVLMARTALEPFEFAEGIAAYEMVRAARRSGYAVAIGCLEWSRQAVEGSARATKTKRLLDGLYLGYFPVIDQNNWIEWRILKVAKMSPTWLRQGLSDFAVYFSKDGGRYFEGGVFDCPAAAVEHILAAADSDRLR